MVDAAGNAAFTEGEKRKERQKEKKKEKRKKEELVSSIIILHKHEVIGHANRLRWGSCSCPLTI